MDADGRGHVGGTDRAPPGGAVGLAGPPHARRACHRAQGGRGAGMHRPARRESWVGGGMSAAVHFISRLCATVTRLLPFMSVWSDVLLPCPKPVHVSNVFLCTTCHFLCTLRAVLRHAPPPRPWRRACCPTPATCGGPWRLRLPSPAACPAPTRRSPFTTSVGGSTRPLGWSRSAVLSSWPPRKPRHDQFAAWAAVTILHL